MTGDVQTYPGQLVHAIGYPLGWKDRANKLPVWKAGQSRASLKNSSIANQGFSSTLRADWVSLEPP